MNIFVLHEDPREAARMHCNKHVPKMVVEAAQMLCTVLASQGHVVPYRPTHAHHPCTLWASKDPANTVWLFEHALELVLEHANRFGKVHKTLSVFKQIAHFLPNANWHDHTPFAQAMPEHYKHVDAVTAYRQYYIGEKSRFAAWSPKTTTPAWWPYEEVSQ